MWKIWAELLGGLIVLAAGAYLAAEASDLVPFAIHDWVAFLLSILIMARGWQVIEQAWKQI